MRVSSQIGIWTDYGHVEPAGVLDVIEAVGETGIDGIEVFAEHLAYFHDDPDRLADHLETAGIDLSGVYFNVDPAEFDAVIEEAADLSRTVEAVGGDFLVVGAGPDIEEGEERTAADFEAMAELLHGIAGEASEHGVETVVHPHRGQLIETPEDLKALLDAGLDRNRVGLCVHASHQHAVGADPYAIYESYPEWVEYFHVSDVDSAGEGDLLGEGVLDQDRLHDPIFGAGYDGWIVIEGSKPGVSTREYVEHAAGYVREELVPGA